MADNIDTLLFGGITHLDEIKQQLSRCRFYTSIDQVKETFQKTRDSESTSFPRWIIAGAKFHSQRDGSDKKVMFLVMADGQSADVHTFYAYWLEDAWFSYWRKRTSVASFWAGRDWRAERHFSEETLREIDVHVLMFLTPLYNLTADDLQNWQISSEISDDIHDALLKREWMDLEYLETSLKENERVHQLITKAIQHFPRHAKGARKI